MENATWANTKIMTRTAVNWKVDMDNETFGVYDKEITAKQSNAPTLLNAKIKRGLTTVPFRK